MTRFRLGRFARGAGALRADHRAATAIEYALMAALLALAIIPVVLLMGQGIKTTLYDAIVNALASMSR